MKLIGGSFGCGRWSVWGCIPTLERGNDKNFLIDKVDLSALNAALTLVVDKCKNKEEISDFNRYLTNQLEARLPLNTPLNIYHEDSKANTGLQAVDLFCWGVFRKYEHEDTQWYSDFKSQISFETEYLGG